MNAIEMLEVVDAITKAQNILRRDIDAVQQACPHERHEQHPAYVKVRPESPVLRCCVCGRIKLV